MCGRISQQIAGATLKKVLGSGFPTGTREARVGYNVAPGRPIAALSQKGLAMEPWGVRSRQHFVINARLETVTARPLFRRAWEAGRRVVPVNGYYEWNPDRRVKQARFHHLADEPVLWLAALQVQPPEDNEAGLVIVTREAQGEIAQWHHRMPGLLAPEALSAFLAGESPLWHTRSDQLSAHPVSLSVNRATFESPQCVERVEAIAEPEQMELF